MFEDVPKAPGLWKRLLLGALLVIVASASATAVAAFREVDRVVNAFKEGETLELGGELAEADTGKPQTIMLIGSDKRAKTAKDAAIGAAEDPRSDTIILVRLDPKKGATALMSLPRDLRVQIPGHGTAKINEAFSIGGPKLTLRTVKRLTGLTINHVINVNFRGFREAVNEIGCVYLDIDRRYFNENRGGASNYAAIDVKQGYRKLCGEKALQYVRYRHTDNDLVRGARQQEFLRQAKSQVGVRRLFDDRDKLAKIFGRYTDSDIRSRKSVLRLIKLAVASAGNPIREVHFEGRITSGDAERGVPSYVIASSPAVRKLTQQFLGAEETKGPRGKTESRRKKRRKRSNGSDTAGLEAAPDAGRQQAVAAIGDGIKFAPYYPRMRPRASQFQDKPLVYGIRDPEGKIHNAFRIVIRHSSLGEYSGLQGTTWKSPPILQDPSETRRIRGRKYELHYDGDRLRLVAWRTDEAVYWISNTLLQSLNEKQMLAMARSARSL